MVHDKNPDRKVMELFWKTRSLTGCQTFVSKAGGYRNEQHYIYESDVTPRMHLITKPFFFLSAKDDPFFGPDCIPIDHCFD
jgi:predicted alpha/beta-fold hydrolase